MKIDLKHNKGFKWYTNHTIYFKGYFYVDEHFYEKENALKFLSNEDNLKDVLKKINGVFTILKKEKNNLFITCDITRSFPIFYTQSNNKFFLSDDIQFLKTKCEQNSFDKTSEIELQASNHTYGKKTLLKNVYQLQAGECLEIKNNAIVYNTFNYNYAIKEENNSNLNTLQKQAIIAFENSFKRLILSLKNQTVVLPLSGGFDSRLIAVMLKKYNYNNVICYTYGKKNSFEIENSKKTADKLGFKWLFIEYNEHLIQNFLDTNEFKNYVNYAGKLSSMPNLQEYFAVSYLKKEQLITNDAVFIPGYAGDILGGSEYLNNIPKNLNFNKIEDIILETKMNNYRFTNQEKNNIKQEIKKTLQILNDKYTDYVPETILDDFNIRERIAKYIFNSASFYTYFGYEFRFPFWDKELMNFFKEVPIYLKQNKLLFNEVLIHQYFKPFNVYFEDKIEHQHQKKWIKKAKKQIKSFLPTFIKEKKIANNDWNNYQIITKKMLIFLKKKGVKVERNYNNYNEIITQWYIYISKNGFD